MEQHQSFNKNRFEISKLDSIKINEEFYQKIIRFLNKEKQVNLEFYRRNFIEKRLKLRMIRLGFKQLESYYKHLVFNKDEIEKFMESFCINCTHFFRNWEVFDQFQNLFIQCLYQRKEFIKSDLKPDPLKIIRKKNESKENGEKYHKILRKDNSNYCKNTSNLIKNENLKKFFKHTSLYRKIENNKHLKNINPILIWSCPCASGEEPYSIAMILDNLKIQIKNFPDFKIVASDIDMDAIKKAKNGIFYDNSTKEISRFYELKYFKKKKLPFGNEYTLNEKIKNSVEFITEDITKAHKKNWKYDIIFCRYIMIYLNREKREDFIKAIENKLAWGGLLIIGKTETLLDTSCKLKLVDLKNHIYLKNSSYS